MYQQISWFLPKKFPKTLDLPKKSYCSKIKQKSTKNSSKYQNYYSSSPSSPFFFCSPLNTNPKSTSIQRRHRTAINLTSQRPHLLKSELESILMISPWHHLRHQTSSTSSSSSSSSSPQTSPSSSRSRNDLLVLIATARRFVDINGTLVGLPRCRMALAGAPPSSCVLDHPHRSPAGPLCASHVQLKVVICSIRPEN